MACKLQHFIYNSHNLCMPIFAIIYQLYYSHFQDLCLSLSLFGCIKITKVPSTDYIPTFSCVVGGKINTEIMGRNFNTHTPSSTD